MTKDPAFLFYSSDFLTGTMTMTMEERGQYVTLLALMHQKGRLKIETIRLIVGSISDNLMEKFEKDENGLFFNRRLELEIEKRRSFNDSRRENGKKGGRPPLKKITESKPSGLPIDKASDNHTEDVNVNVNDNGKEGVGEKPSSESNSQNQSGTPQSSEPATAVLVFNPSPSKPKREKKLSIGSVAQNPPELLMVQCYWAEWTVYSKQPRPGWTKDIAFMLAEEWYDSMLSRNWVVGKSGKVGTDWKAMSRTGIRNAEKWDNVSKAARTLNGQSIQENGNKTTFNNRDQRSQGVRELRERALAVVIQSGIDISGAGGAAQ